MHYTNIVDISRDTYEKNSIETIVDNDQILCLNEKHIKEGLDHKQLREITIKYNSNHGKHRFKLVDQPRKCNRILIKEKLAIKVIMDLKLHQLINLDQLIHLNNMI